MQRKFSNVARLAVASLFLSLFALIPVQVSLAPEAKAADCSATASNNLTATAAHGKVFYIDSGVTPKVDAAYVGYKINNTAGSGSQTGLWVSLESFSGGKVGLANPSDSYQQLPSIASGSYKTAFFLVKASGPTTLGQTHTVKIYNKRPDLTGASALLTCTFTFTAVKETIKASANKVNTVTSSLSPASATLGGTLTISVTSANTGKVGQGSAPDNSLFWVSPAAVSTWPTRSLRLESTSVVLSCTAQSTVGQNNTVTLTDTLSYSNANTQCFAQSNGTWTASYVFRIIGPGPTSLTPSPVAMIASGTQYKHSDIAGLSFGTPVNLSGVASSAFTVTVTASSTVVSSTSSNAVVRYTVTMTTTSTTAVRVDEIIDKRANNTTFVANSAKLNGSAIADPVTVASEAGLSPPPLHYIGPFSVVNTSSTTLVYDMNVPCAAGSATYTNVVYALVGDQILGASTTALSAAVVTTITNGESCNVNTSTTTQTINPTGQTYPATNLASDSGTGKSSATLNGYANAYGLANVTAAFRYSKDSNLATSTTLTAQQNVTGSAPVSLSANITNLDPGTTYYFRIEVGSVQGAILNFTTPPILAQPVVTTGSVTNISGSNNNMTAQLNGFVNANLNTLSPITFEYCAFNASTCNATTMSANISTITVKTDDGTGSAANLSLSGSGDYPVDTTNIDGSQQITSLNSGTTYYYRTVATCTSTVTTYCPNNTTKFTGSIRQFTLGVIVVTTSDATAVASTTATLNGTANANSVSSQTWQFRYCAAGAGCTASSLSGTTNSPGTATSITGNSTSSITTNLTGLTANTTYYFQAVGLDGGVAKSFGDILSFTTITITTSSLPGGTKDVSYTSSVAGSGGSGSYSFAVTSGSLPTGLTMSTDGLISGTPSVAGTYNFTVTLTDLFYNTTTTKNLSIVVIEVVTSAASSISATGATLNGSSTVNLGTPKFCYSSSNPNGNFDASTCTSAAAAEANSPYTAALTGLTASTTYWFQLNGTSGGNTYYGATLTFKTLPTVTTVAANSIAATSATIRGSATEELTGGTLKLCFSSTNPAGNFDYGTCEGGTVSGTFSGYSRSLSGLNASTTYYFQMMGQLGGNTYYGEKLSFKTIPVLTASAASSIAATSATIGATATESLTDPRLCFSSTNPAGNFDWSAASCSSGTTSGTNAGYTENLTGLTASTTYYFQLSGKVDNVIYYSDKLSFKTLPTVTTTAANSVGSTTATIGGTATEELTSGTLKLCFSSTNPSGNFDYASCDGGTVSGTFGSYSRSLSGLTASTQYFFQMMGQLGGSTYYGTVLNFTTSAANAVYTVTFNGNSPTSGSPEAASVTQASSGASVALTGAGNLAKTGYTFGGWNENTLGTGTNRNAGANYTPTGDITLYAKWNANTYTITYKAGANGTGSDIVDSFVFENSISLRGSNAALTRSGYSIGGWSLTDGGAQAYALSASYSSAANLILYPVWSAGTFTVTYNYDNATGGNGTASSNFTSGGAPVTLPSPTKTGYSFSGWHSDSNKTVLVGGAADPYSPTQSLTLYAKWTINQYTITYDGNLSNGGATPTAVTQNYNTTFTVATNTFTRTGYSFVNWNSDPAGTGVWYTENVSTYTIGAANASLYAIWSINTYTVTYNGNSNDGGTVPVDGSSPYNYSSTVTVLGNTGNLTRAGYTFGGWNTQNDGQGTPRAAASTFTLGAANVILFAVWTQNSSGGSGTPTPTAPVVPAPVITSISKAEICATGNEVVISGNYFDGGRVSLDGLAVVVRSISNTSINVVLPQSNSGTRTVTVVTQGGTAIATIKYVDLPKPKFVPVLVPYLSQGEFVNLPISATNASSYAVIGKLPGGLNLNPTTGTISGTPSENGIFGFFITASGICGETNQLIELDIDKETPNAISHRINILPGATCINDSAKASMDAFLEKVKSLAPRNLIPEIYMSGGGIGSGSDLGDERRDCLCELFLEEEVYGNVLEGEFIGSANRIEIIVYWARP